MNGEVRGRRRALRSAPLAWLLLVVALLGPLAVSANTNRPTRVGSTTVVAPAMAAAGTAVDSPDGDTDGSPGVNGLPPKIHLIVNRGAAGAAPLVPVLAVLAAPADRTDAGIRLATDRAGTSPAAAPPGNSHWGRAPPRASA